MNPKIIFNSLIVLASLSGTMAHAYDGHRSDSRNADESVTAAPRPAALQKPLVCTNARGDQGHTIVLRRNARGQIASATVSEITIRGAQTLAVLPCQATGERASHPDGTTTVATCREPRLRDGGYTVILSAGGYTGMTWAELSEQGYAGSSLIAKIPCGYRE